MSKKTVKLKEAELVQLIEHILDEAVKVKKTEWLQEQANNGKNQVAILEEKISNLEKRLNKIK